MFRTRNKLLLFVFYSAIKKSELTDEMLNSIKKDWIVNKVSLFSTSQLVFLSTVADCCQLRDLYQIKINQ